LPLSALNHCQTSDSAYRGFQPAAFLGKGVYKDIFINVTISCRLWYLVDAPKADGKEKCSGNSENETKFYNCQIYEWIHIYDNKIRTRKVCSMSICFSLSMDIFGSINFAFLLQLLKKRDMNMSTWFNLAHSQVPWLLKADSNI